MTDSSDNINNGSGGLETETVEQCPLCGSSESTFRFETFDRLYRLPGKFGMITCDGCGLYRLSPRPTPASIGMYYPDDYGAYVTPGSMDGKGGRFRMALKDGVRKSVLASLGYEVGPLSVWQKVLQPVFVKRFYGPATYSYGDKIPRFVPDGRALEIGCGNCRYLGLLKRFGWDVTGVDMSAQAARTAKEAYDIDVRVGQLHEVELDDESFDYAHLSHVVEHFFDPLETMRTIARLLKPGGIAYIEVPNGKGLGAEMCGEYWYGWDPPRHLFTFAPDTCRMLMEKAGLTVTKLKTGLTDTFDWEIAYRSEDAAGKILSRPPKLSAEQAVRAASRAREEERLFAGRPMDGDFISCWVSKPRA